MSDRQDWKKEYYNRFGHIFQIYGGFDDLAKEVQDFISSELAKKEAEFAEELRNIARKLPEGEESVALAIAFREMLVLVSKYTKEVSNE